jgi:hypothetical protein
LAGTGAQQQSLPRTEQEASLARKAGFAFNDWIPLNPF